MYKRLSFMKVIRYCLYINPSNLVLTKSIKNRFKKNY